MGNQASLFEYCSDWALYIVFYVVIEQLAFTSLPLEVHKSKILVVVIILFAQCCAYEGTDLYQQEEACRQKER